MSGREQHRGTTTLLRPRRAGHREVPPSPGPEPTPRTTGFWPLLVLVIVGTLALAAWALWPIGGSDLDGAGSGYAGDWKDTVASERAVDAAGLGGTTEAGNAAWSARLTAQASSTGDWKDSVVTGRAGAGDLDRPGPGYTGDWKDTVATDRAR